MQSLQHTRTLITGAAGFIGANLVRALVARGADVHGIVRSTTELQPLEDVRARINLHHADLTDGSGLRRVVQRVRPELIFHLAVERADGTLGDRTATLSTSVLGTFHLLEAAAAVGYRRLVHVGGSLEYGPRDRALRESDAPRPVTLYGAARAAATILCEQHARATRRPIVVLRPFSVYGPFEPASRLVPTAIRAALCGVPLPLTGPRLRRDLIFVADVVRAILLASEHDAAIGEVINVGTGVQWTNDELVECIAAAAGRRITVQSGSYPPHPSDTHHWVADTRKARARLRFTPRYTLAQGLAATVAWFRRRDRGSLAGENP